MKKKTYDVPAYKVGLILIEGEENIEHSIYDYEWAIDKGKEIIVPFEDVDGLSVREVQEWLHIEEIYLQFYYQFQSQNLKINQISKHAATAYKTWFFIGNIQEEDLDTPIDQVIENTMEKLYDTMDDEAKTYIHCFFERYQDKSYDITKERIKRLENNN